MIPTACLRAKQSGTGDVDWWAVDQITKIAWCSLTNPCSTLVNTHIGYGILFTPIVALGTPTYEWDPRSIWLFHAKRIFYDGSIFSVADNYASFSHNEYPNLVPAFSSSLATLLGYWNEVLPKLSFLFMYLPPLILSFAIFKNIFPIFIYYFTRYSNIWMGSKKHMVISC